MCLSIYLSVCLSVYLFVCLFVYLSIALSIYPSVLPTFVSLYLSICLSVHTICLSVCLSIYLSIHLSSSFSLYLCLLLLTAENRSFWCWKLEKQNVTENFGITLPIRCSFFCLHVFKTLCLPRKSASRKMISKNDDCSNTKSDLFQEINVSELQHVAGATQNAPWPNFFKCATPASVFVDAAKPTRLGHFCVHAEFFARTSKNAPYPSVVCIFDFQIIKTPHICAPFDILTSRSAPDLTVFNQS